MKPFHSLTELGQARRLRNLAIEALHAYPLAARRVRLLSMDTNAFFRVDTDNREKYVLRICTPGEHSQEDNETEIAWLTSLNQNTTIPVVNPIANLSGNPITVAESPGVPEARRCTLFEWVPGRRLNDCLTPENYRKLGATMAQLHNYAQDSGLSKKLSPMHWDKVFYYPHEPVVIHDPAYACFFPSERLAVINEVCNRAERLFTSLFNGQLGPIILHGDMHVWNVHVHRGTLHILDFEDIMLGYPIQDIAITLSYKWDIDGYDDLYTAFAAGYRSHRAWPSQSKAEMKTLIAARRVMFLNYVAHKADELHDVNPDEYIARIGDRIAEWLEDPEKPI